MLMVAIAICLLTARGSRTGIQPVEGSACLEQHHDTWPLEGNCALLSKRDRDAGGFAFRIDSSHHSTEATGQPAAASGSDSVR